MHRRCRLLLLILNALTHTTATTTRRFALSRRRTRDSPQSRRRVNDVRGDDNAYSPTYDDDKDLVLDKLGIHSPTQEPQACRQAIA